MLSFQDFYEKLYNSKVFIFSDNVFYGVGIKSFGKVEYDKRVMMYFDLYDLNGNFIREEFEFLNRFYENYYLKGNLFFNKIPKERLNILNFGDRIYLADHERERVYAEEVCRIGHDRQGNIFYNDNRAEECFKTEAEAWERLRNG